MEKVISAVDSYFPEQTTAERNAFPELSPNWLYWLSVVEMHNIMRVGNDGVLYLAFYCYPNCYQNLDPLGSGKEKII